MDEWKKQLSDLEAAYRKVSASIADTSAINISGSVVVPSISIGGGAGSLGSPSVPDTPQKYKITAYMNGELKTLVSGLTSMEQAKKSRETLIDAYKKVYDRAKETYNNSKNLSAAERASAEDFFDKAMTNWKNVKNSKITAYKKGGLVDFTGPAWVDGTKSNPEAFLNPVQTKNIGLLASALDKIMATTLGYVSSKDYYGGSGGDITFEGDIIVQVEKLESEQDYEEMASRVGSVILKKLGKTMAVGGLRMR
ncbi:MAG: hypothetical protein Q4B50_08810 [Bacillota bacterium]|nr:hypothetical protein [Bacillota bacterium]